MSDTIRGTKFSYRIDTEYGMNHDGFIAEGTESIVFKGIKYGNNLRYSCALKFKPKTRMHDFMNREYKILESMQTCRSIVRVLDVIEDLGDFCLPYLDGEISSQKFFCVVEEYIDGDSLQDYCIKQWFEYDHVSRQWRRNSREYSYREIVKYQNQIVHFMINLCEIMKFVSNINEDNGKTSINKSVVLHCDIKPENIMVTKHGQELVLIDFGRSVELMEGRKYQYYSDKIAKTFLANYSDSQWQDIGKDNFYSYGTVGYSAPECFAKASAGVYPFELQKDGITNGCVSIESDIFGFGTTFWECLSIYEMCTKALESEESTNNPNFFNKSLLKKYESDIHSNSVEGYCDRDFRYIHKAYHESLEAILKKCTRSREKGFQEPALTKEIYYHNFQILQNDIERARDTIPSLDRKSDPLVRQMVGVAGFCCAFTICFLCMYIILLIFSNSFAWDKWNSLKSNYTDNQKELLVSISDEMMQSPFTDTKYENLDEILSFMHNGEPNDDVVDQEEADIITDLLNKYITDEAKTGAYLDVVMQNAKSDNMDEIAKSVYRVNLSDDYASIGYELAKAIAQVNDADDSDSEKLVPAYQTLLKYANNSDYNTAIVKLANKLTTGKKVDTIASNLNTERETIRNELNSLI